VNGAAVRQLERALEEMREDLERAKSTDSTRARPIAIAITHAETARLWLLEAKA
jgi:hypothetical protein